MIAAAITAINAAGRGRLYFPGGDGYLISAGGLPTITADGMVLGDGSTGYDTGTGRTGGTLIRCDDSTGVAFTITSPDLLLQHFTLRNRSGTTPTAGAGIAYTRAATIDQKGRLDFDDVTVDGFYDNVDYQGGTFWRMRHSALANGVRYSIRIRNVSDPDWGMWAISDTYFWTASDRSYNTAAAIRLESSGGGKITGCNFISKIDRFIDISASGTTSSLVVSNCQMENYNIDAVRSVGSWPFMVFSNLEIAQYSPNTTGHAFNLSSDTDVIIANTAFNTNTSTATAIQHSSMTRLAIGANVTNNGFLHLYNAPPDQDATGGVGAEVYITGTPTAGQVPVASSGTAAAWGTIATGVTPAAVRDAGRWEPTVDDGTDTLIFDSHTVVMDWTTS
jgi:hypothetical protein